MKKEMKDEADRMMTNFLFEIYQKHPNSREQYEEEVAKKILEMGMPSDLRKVFMGVALQIFDKMKKND